jgi:hypothetical protein
MIWGCISARELGNIHFIDGIMDKYVYNGILKKNVKEITIKMGMPYVYMFQQNKNTKHNAELNRQWLIWNVPKRLKMLVQSPDLNRIEHLWAILKRGFHKVSIKSKSHLKRAVIREWEHIIPEISRNLVNYVHRRCVSVIRAEIYATKYWNFKCLLLVWFFLYKLESSVRTEMLRKIDMFSL